MKRYYLKMITDLLNNIDDINRLNRIYDIVADAWMHEKEMQNGY